jgi:hypothetical protein
MQLCVFPLFPSKSETDLDLGHQAGAISYQVEQKTSRLWLNTTAIGQPRSHYALRSIWFSEHYMLAGIRLISRTLQIVQQTRRLRYLA